MLGGPLKRSGVPPPSGSVTPPRCGLLLRRRSQSRRQRAGHGSLRKLTPTRAAFARPGPGANPFPDVLARMQPSDSRPPVGRGSGRPWPVAYPVPRATRRKKGLPGAWAVLFQRAVGSDPAGCASRLAHRVETAIAFRLHNALGTQNERYFVAVNPTAHSLACLRIGVFVTADAARLATGVGGSPFTGRVSHPLDGKQSLPPPQNLWVATQQPERF